MYCCLENFVPLLDSGMKKLDGYFFIHHQFPTLEEFANITTGKKKVTIFWRKKLKRIKAEYFKNKKI